MSGSQKKGATPQKNRYIPPATVTPQKHKSSIPEKKVNTEPKQKIQEDEDFYSGLHQGLGNVSYKYPKGLTTSYAAAFNPKEVQKQIAFFNYNTYNPKKVNCKMDLKTSKQVILLHIL